MHSSYMNEVFTLRSHPVMFEYLRYLLYRHFTLCRLGYDPMKTHIDVYIKPSLGLVFLCIIFSGGDHLHRLDIERKAEKVLRGTSTKQSL